MAERIVPRGKPRSAIALALRRCLEEALEQDRAEAIERAERRGRLIAIPGGRRSAA